MEVFGVGRVLLLGVWRKKGVVLMLVWLEYGVGGGVVKVGVWCCWECVEGRGVVLIWVWLEYSVGRGVGTTGV